MSLIKKRPIYANPLKECPFCNIIMINKFNLTSHVLNLHDGQEYEATSRRGEVVVCSVDDAVRSILGRADYAKLEKIHAAVETLNGSATLRQIYGQIEDDKKKNGFANQSAMTQYIGLFPHLSRFVD